MKKVSYVTGDGVRVTEHEQCAVVSVGNYHSIIGDYDDDDWHRKWYAKHDPEYLEQLNRPPDQKLLDEFYRWDYKNKNKEAV